MSKTPCAQYPWWPDSISFQRCLGPILVLLLAPLAAQAAPSTTVTATTQKLDFGTFAVLPSCASCTVIMSATGVRSKTGGVILSNTNPGKPGAFTVTCNNGSCTWGASAAGATTIPAGGVTMTVGSYTVAKAGANTPSTVTVGATLTIPNAGVARGTFGSGNFTVTTTP